MLFALSVLATSACEHTDTSPTNPPEPASPEVDVAVPVDDTEQATDTAVSEDINATQDQGPEPDPEPTTVSQENRWLEACDATLPEHRTVDTGEVVLHTVCQGQGPTVVLLHGFPEFWFSWHRVMDGLAADHRLIAPDQRGYNTSEKPAALDAYTIPHLVSDVAGLIQSISETPVVLVAHDWGGAVAWYVAHDHHELLRGLVILNGPHPNVLSDLLANDPAQQSASSYVSFFVSPGAEATLSANDFGMLAGFFENILTPDELDAYKEAWGQPGALTGGLNWYRANDFATLLDGKEITIDIPTLVLWGLDDTALLPQNLDGLDQYVDDLEVITYPGVSHWIEHEAHEEVAEAIRDFVTSLP